VVIGDFRDFLSVKVFSGEGGSYRLTGLPAGEVEAYAERPGFGKASAKLTPSGRETLQWDPVLRKDLEVRGRVVDEEGAALEGFGVLLEQPLGGGSRRNTQKTSKSDADGRFAFAELSDLAYRVTVFEPESPFPCVRVEDVRPGPSEMEVRVEKPARSSAHLLGRVVDSDGTAYAGAKVICFGARGGYRVCFTGKDGAFRTASLPRGRYRLEVQALGRASLAVADVETQEDEEHDVGVQSLGPPLR
jgi:hypothetical protein